MPFARCPRCSQNLKGHILSGRLRRREEATRRNWLRRRKNWIGQRRAVRSSASVRRPELEVVLGQPPQCGTACLSLCLDRPPRPPLPFPHSFLPCVTRTCRAGSSPSAASSAAAADVVEQIGVGVVVEAGRHGMTGKAYAVGICNRMSIISGFLTCRECLRSSRSTFDD